MYELTRICPNEECGKVLVYKNKYNYESALKKNSYCRSCKQRGDRHHFWGGKNYPEHMRKHNAEKWKGENNPNWGGNFTEAHRKNLSNSMKNSEKNKAQIDRKRDVPRPANVKAKIRLGVLKDLSEKYGYQVSPNYNKSSIALLDEINNTFGWNGQHAENGGEFEVLGYFVDYYEPNYNVVIEYDDRNHRRKLVAEKDIIRQAEIEAHLGCTFLRIDERTDDKIASVIEQLKEKNSVIYEQVLSQTMSTV